MKLVIAGALGLPYAEAEEMKKRAGSAGLYPGATGGPENGQLGVGMVRYPAGKNIYLVGGASSFSQFANVFSKQTGKNVIPSAEPLLVTPLGIAMNADQGKSMDNQTLSQLLDRVIAEVLAQSVAQKNVCVVVTGEDISSLPETLNCLEALELAGYQLWVNFSHSASQSALKSVCMDALIQRGSRAGFDRSPPHYEVLYLPALSVNSMSKIALGIRDNLACETVFQTLQHRKQIIATLHQQCVDSELPMPLLSCLEGYAQVLESYGITLFGKRAAHVKSVQGSQSTLTVAGKKRLITQSDIRLLTIGTVLRIESDTLITPAARDEIQRRNLTVIHG